MVSFSCNSCQDTLKKPKLVQHFQRCHAPFTCLDCNKEMWDGEFQKHTTCISEAEKYEKTVYKGDKKKNKQQQKNEQKPQAQQQQPKPAEVPSAAATTPALATPSVPSTSAPVTNGTTKPAPIDSEAIAAQVKAAPSDVAAPPAKKERKRKRASQAAKIADADAGNTSEAQVANALLPEKVAEKAAPVETPAQKPAENKEAEVKTESQRSKKRARKSKGKETAAVNGDVSAMQVDAKPAVNGALKEATAASSEPAPTVDLKETLEKKIPEKGKSVSLADCLAGLPAEKIQEVLGGLRVQRGKKEKFELTVGYT